MVQLTGGHPVDFVHGHFFHRHFVPGNFVLLPLMVRGLPVDESHETNLLKEVKNLNTQINLLYSKLNDLSETNEKDIKDNVKPQSDLGGMCLSEACIDSSHRLLKNMDLEVDPCEDFYRYSCGNYMKEAIIPDDQKKLTSFSPLEDISVVFYDVSYP